MKKILQTLLIGCLIVAAIGEATAQQTFPRNGVYDDREGWYAFTNATIHTAYNQTVEKGTLVIRNGKIEAVGKDVLIPKGAIEVDLNGKHIYPSFIDIYTNYGLPEPKAVGKEPAQKPQMLSNKEGVFAWNEALKPEYRAAEAFSPNDKEAAAYRKLGFGAVLTHQMDGISRGTSCAVLLGKEKAHEMMLQPSVAHHLSFNKGESTQAYPTSLMGSIALLRQTYYDAQWYASQSEETNLSLAAWNEVQSLPQIFETGNRLDILRVDKLAKEFDKKYIIAGSGDEYQRLAKIKTTGMPLILPLDFPDAYDVEDPFDALQVSLAQMKHWELAPTNPAAVAKAGIEFAFTTHSLEKKEQFLTNLRKAIENGLSEEAALKALTETPAKMLNLSAELGSLAQGKVASFLITDGPVFDKNSAVLENWVAGKHFQIEDHSTAGLAGRYNLKVGNSTYDLNVDGKPEKMEMTISKLDTGTLSVEYAYDKGLISLWFEPQKEAGKVRLSGMVDGKNWSGKGQDAGGQWVSWSATYQGPPKAEKKQKKEAEAAETAPLGKIIYPFTAYGWENRPQQSTYLIRNATVWTNESDGILENTDVLVRNGKIAQIGSRLSDRSAVVIDGSGKHLTAGIIDEHSHIAVTRGVNEASQSSSAEVRIGDVLNSEDINIYRQLSGGVTVSQILHGSANPIGGQSAIIKLRWGYTPEEMKVANADGFIKFALGENVKQSNRSDDYRIRYPQTRMGVEQTYVDHFTRAREYGKLRDSGKPFRRDLDLEALLEILESKRFITCHSYQQGEINMLMKVAERFDFRVNTFTHILEGYKVADKMAKHGVGGSTFSDWWAYKYEVVEAIPYNSALMHEQGVTVAVNSDDAEMARRLNQEAAKAVLFGGVSEEEALKFVTLNPAKLLHIDDRVGSVKVGKDADMVLWSDHPLSVYAKAEKTFIDGILFFDRDKDVQQQEVVEKERTRLIQKMLAVKKKGGKTQPARGKSQYHEYHCDDIEHEQINHTQPCIMKINIIKYIVLFCWLAAMTPMQAQSPVPAPAQEGPIAIVGATAHLGNGQVINNSLIAFADGKLTVVEAFNQQSLDKYQVVQAEGKHVYPGLIAPNTQLGLIEIGAVRATRDNDETGSLNPNVRSIIAYNTDSQVTPTVRCQGVLLAQVTPEGGLISGQSSVVQLDAWNWEDAAYLTDGGIHVRLPAKRSYSWRSGTFRKNESYDEQLEEIENYFAEAKAYCQQNQPVKENLKLAAACGLFDGSKKLYVHANSVEDMTQAMLLAKKNGLNLVIVGGRDAWRITDQLVENNVAIILESTQRLPGTPDEAVDLPFRTPQLLQEAGVLYCIGHQGFWEYRNLAFQAGQAVGYGLAYEDAISALTLNTAKILGIDDRAGSLEVGKDAILFICQGDVLDMRSSVVEAAYIQGRQISLDNKQKALYHKFQEKYRQGR